MQIFLSYRTFSSNFYELLFSLPLPENFFVAKNKYLFLKKTNISLLENLGPSYRYRKFSDFKKQYYKSLHANTQSQSHLESAESTASKTLLILSILTFEISLRHSGQVFLNSSFLIQL